MDQQLYDFGMIGLGVMGRNFLLNVADDGFGALGTDINQEAVQSLNEEGEGMRVKGVATQAEFVQLLSRPRKIMLLVPAGKIVDKVIEGLLPLLDEDDIIIDGGNSHYDDTNRRYAELKGKGIRFLGTGVSGGAKGARLGPSIMPGGDRGAWEAVKPVLETVAAKVNGEPCVTYIGESSSGHYVKMVHNGIEYGLMQLISEAYDLLHRVGGLSNQRLHEVFSEWNRGRLNSFLVEITVDNQLASLKETLGIATPWIAELPYLVQVVMIMLIFEFGQYWMHRFMHNNDALWSTHAPHHHVTQLNALKGFIGNPIELFLIGLSVIALFDFDPIAYPAAFLSLGAIAQYAHANIKSNPPVWFSFFFTTIRHHSLHHTALSYEDTRCNYGNSVILWDRLFGTFKDGESEIVGQDDRRRLSIIEQWLFPITFFQNKRRDAHAPAE